jgi:hypothetical protein
MMRLLTSSRVRFSRATVLIPFMCVVIAACSDQAASLIGIDPDLAPQAAGVAGTNNNRTDEGGETETPASQEPSAPEPLSVNSEEEVSELDE